MKLRSVLFVLPNLFTVSGLCCGFYAITECLGDPTPQRLYRAALAIFFAMFFDMFDGRIARMTKTQSDFGIQLDSLADLVSFGVAPALLTYVWGLEELGLLGLAAAFGYAACGALRLARFNVLAQRKTSEMRYFVGLPIPLAAGMIVSLVIASYAVARLEIERPVSLMILVVALSYLMISNVRYRTFKDLQVTRKKATILFTIVTVLAGLILVTHVRGSFVLVVFFAGYITLGLLEEVVFFRRRRAAAVGPQSGAGEAIEDASIDEDEADDNE